MSKETVEEYQRAIEWIHQQASEKEVKVVALKMIKFVTDTHTISLLSERRYTELTLHKLKEKLDVLVPSTSCQDVSVVHNFVADLTEVLEACAKSTASHWSRKEKKALHAHLYSLKNASTIMASLKQFHAWLDGNAILLAKITVTTMYFEQDVWKRNMRTYDFSEDDATSTTECDSDDGDDDETEESDPDQDRLLFLNEIESLSSFAKTLETTKGLFVSPRVRIEWAQALDALTTNVLDASPQERIDSLAQCLELAKSEHEARNVPPEHIQSLKKKSDASSMASFCKWASKEKPSRLKPLVKAWTQIHNKPKSEITLSATMNGLKKSLTSRFGIPTSQQQAEKENLVSKASKAVCDLVESIPAWLFGKKTEPPPTSPPEQPRIQASVMDLLEFHKQCIHSCKQQASQYASLLSIALETDGFRWSDELRDDARKLCHNLRGPLFLVNLGILAAWFDKNHDEIYMPLFLFAELAEMRLCSPEHLYSCVATTLALDCKIQTMDPVRIALARLEADMCREYGVHCMGKCREFLQTETFVSHVQMAVYSVFEEQEGERRVLQEV